LHYDWIVRIRDLLGYRYRDQQVCVGSSDLLLLSEAEAEWPAREAANSRVRELEEEIRRLRRGRDEPS